MFMRVNVECTKQGLSLKDLANITSIKYDTMLRKMNGHSEFNRIEMLKIKRAFGNDIPLEELFEEQQTQ